MKITKRQLRRIIKEAQFGRFTGGAAPLDVPMRDSGPVPKDQLRKMADIFMNDMGMSPEEVLEKPEFVEQGITDLKQLEESIMKITKRQLRRIIREAVEVSSYNIQAAIDRAKTRGHSDAEIQHVVDSSNRDEEIIMMLDLLGSDEYPAPSEEID